MAVKMVIAMLVLLLNGQARGNIFTVQRAEAKKKKNECRFQECPM